MINELTGTGSDFTIEKLNAMADSFHQKPYYDPYLYVSRPTLNFTKYLSYLDNLESSIKKFRSNTLRKQLKKTKWKRAYDFNEWENPEHRNYNPGNNILDQGVHVSDAVSNGDVLFVNPDHLKIDLHRELKPERDSLFFSSFLPANTISSPIVRITGFDS